MNFDPNPLFYQMANIFSEHRKHGLVKINNEGGSRSAKTYSFFDLLTVLFDHNRNASKTCYMQRDTLTHCRDFTHTQYMDYCRKWGLLDQIKGKESPKPEYLLWGNKIYFRGLVEERGAGGKSMGMEAHESDYLFINEALETSKGKVDGWEMRCKSLMVKDWNPKYTSHWCFNEENEPNTFYTHSTYRDNKHVHPSFVVKVESYEPWLPGSYIVDYQANQCFYKGKPIDDKNQPPPHPENVKAGTADAFRWKVYGLGLRSAMDGVIFNNVRYIDEWPLDIAPSYGMDFGFTVDPLAFVRFGESKNEIFAELLCYKPISDPQEIHEYLQEIGIRKSAPITADSADKYTAENKGTVQMVADLRGMGWEIQKVSKTKSIMYWVGKMQKKRINIVSNHLTHHARKEQENYTFKKVNGIQINQPIDGFDHFWAALRYAYMAANSKFEVFA